MKLKATRWVAVVAAVIVAVTGLGATASAGHASAAASHALISGDGSTWSQNAVNQWISDVQQNGLQVVYTGVGSAQGRTDFANSTNDFAVSDIGYQGVDPVTQQSDTSSRPYAYVPIVAGGTSFPYQIRVRGQLVRTLRLSGLTIAKIFTNKITNWDDPAITADNNGAALPSIPIIPVVHSEGAGSTAQFTTWLATEYPDIWKSYAGYSSFTEYYPRQGAQKAANGSDGVMNFITSAAANGSIGYDEYSYALAKNYPVAKVQNTAGYFTLPTQYNVAVALTKAQINMDKTSKDYLLQNLSQVYVFNDPRTYPLSSYSYGIIPTAPTCGGSAPAPPNCDTRMSTAKRQTLADYLFYSTCQGQAEIGPIGYSPMPLNLVEASFQQIDKLGTADPSVDLSNIDAHKCNNPTYQPGQPDSFNYLAQIAPFPSSCDKAGAGPCGAGVDSANSNPTGGKVPGATKTTGTGSTKTGATGGGGGGSSTSGGGSGGSSVGVSTSGTGAGSQASSSGSGVDAITGQPIGSDNSSVGGQANAVPTVLAADSAGSGLGVFLASTAVLLLLLLLVLPPFLVERFRTGRGPE